MFSCGEYFAVLRCQTEQRQQIGRKGGEDMKNMKLVVGVLFLGGAIGLGGTSARAEGVISKEVSTEGSYCHAKFETIREETLASSRPVLKDVDDIVDFYGPCDHDPLGKEEIQAQKIEAQHRFAADYED
jgi:hypothetical protein